MKKDNLDFEKEWSHTAGQVSERNYIINYILEKSGKFFIEDKTVLANEFKMLAKQLKEDGLEQVNLLNKFINESIIK